MNTTHKTRKEDTEKGTMIYRVRTGHGNETGKVICRANTFEGAKSEAIAEYTEDWVKIDKWIDGEWIPVPDEPVTAKRGAIPVGG